MTTDSNERSPVRGCDGCAAPPDEAVIDNRPGLPALRYRIGTWSTFLARMLEQLPKQEVLDDGRALRPLATLNRSAEDDPAIALIDAWAVVADVLTFYQERIANEGFLRTAVERRSVLELSRAIGYELGPGVAASTYLAFDVDDTKTAPPRVTVPRGAQVQSVPGPGQLPQTFETLEELTAHVAWNTLRPRRTQPQAFVIEGNELALWNTSRTTKTRANRIYLAGTSTGLKVGDPILCVAAGASLGVRVLAVEVDNDTKTTTVHIEGGDAPRLPALPPPTYPPPETTGVMELEAVPLEPATVEAKILAKVWDEDSLAAFCAIQRWAPAELVTVVERILAARAASSQVHAFRQRLGCFGNNAPPCAQVRLQPVPQPSTIKAVLDWYAPSSLAVYRSYEPYMADAIAGQLTAQPHPDPNDWDEHPRSIWEDSHGRAWKTAERPFDVFLERAVPSLVAGGWVLLEDAKATKAYGITRVGDETLADYSMTARATGLALALGAEKKGAFPVRRTTAHVQSEALPLAPLPVADLVEDRASADAVAGANALELDRMVVGLRVGQKALLTGTPIGEDGTPSPLTRSEVVGLGAIVHHGGYTTLYFEEALAHRYVRGSLTLTANVARATHGVTVPREILGSGDASQKNQRFTLQKPPLTWVTAGNARGRASTLTIRVDGAEWTEVPSLYGLGRSARAYTLSTSDEGRTTVSFGNGGSGARLPTGTGNVTATYRSGIGLEGQVAARTLTTLMTRPAGLRGVTNPLAADGAADPEGRDEARGNAPVTVLTLGRIVSLRDYESFTRAFAGVGKARAVALWDGHAELVHLTVATADGSPLEASSALHGSLTAAIASASDGLERVRVDGFTPRFFRVEARVTVEAAFEASVVLANVEAALRGTFDFARRAFGQRATSAEVMTVIQSVRGVVACRLLALVSLTAAGTDAGAGVQAILPAAVAKWSAGAVTLAELLLLHPTGVKLTAEGRS